MVKKSEIQIFLAHAHEDKEAVLKLYERLKKAGYKPWLDKKDLIPGQNWRSVIPRVIKDSQLFIACLSTRSISKRGYVQNELKIALNQLASMPYDSIYFIPLRLDECEIPDLRQDEYGLNLRDLHWLDYWEADGFGKLEAAISYQYGSLTQELKKGQFQSFTEDLGNGVELEMVLIPGGTFIMGSPEGEGRDNEKPQHEVIVSAFYMSKYPITRAQYRQIMGEDPSNCGPLLRLDLLRHNPFRLNPLRFEVDRRKVGKRPVEWVSWNDAIEFCQKLSERLGRRYFLPSEAEWEYACRAGTETAYYCGETITYKQARFKEDSGQTTSVGQYEPNSFGLYDMHGNVFEWCCDDWHKDYENAPTDGIAWFSEGSTYKVIRGGSWNDDPSDCRSAYRDKAFRGIRDKSNRGNNIGFRVVCVAPRTT